MQRRKFSREFKLEAVRPVKDRGVSKREEGIRAVSKSVPCAARAGPAVISAKGARCVSCMMYANLTPVSL